MNLTHKKILVTGVYTQSYPRLRVLIDVLARLNTVVEHSLKNTPRFRMRFLRLLWKSRNQYDYVFIPFPVEKLVFQLLCICLFTKTKLIIDCFTSIQDMYVYDRKLARKYSLKHLYYYCLDWFSCHIGHVLIFDTEEQRDYFKNTFGFSKNTKTYILPVSVDVQRVQRVAQDALSPVTWTHNAFKVIFLGYFIPLQGIEYIVDAAQLLTDTNIQFVLVGSGQTRALAEERVHAHGLTNVTFMPRISYEAYLAALASADLALGIFGASEKARRVIPNKVIEASALGIPVITGKTPAIQQFFTDKENIFLCHRANARDLANTIVEVQNYPQLKAIGERATMVIHKHFSVEHLQAVLAREY